jgi:hypothetical protein
LKERIALNLANGTALGDEEARSDPDWVPWKTRQIVAVFSWMRSADPSCTSRIDTKWAQKLPREQGRREACGKSSLALRDGGGGWIAKKAAKLKGFAAG